MPKSLDLPALSSAETQSLGDFREAFHPRSLPGKVLLGTSIFCLCFSLLEFGLALQQHLRPPSTILSDSFRQDRVTISLILAGVFILIALANAALYYAHTKHRVDLYASGIVITTWRGSQMFVWEEIMEVNKMPVYGFSRRPTNWTYTIIGYDDRKAQFRGLENLIRIGKVVENQVRRYQD